MKATRANLLLIGAVCIGCVLLFGYAQTGGLRRSSKTESPVQSVLGSEIVQEIRARTIVAVVPGVVVGDVDAQRSIAPPETQPGDLQRR